MGAGMLFALRGETGLLGHRETDGSLHVYLGFRVPEHWIDTIDFADPPAARAAILDLLDGWSDALRGMIADADTPLTPRRINALPAGHCWKRVPGVTLLGDAAHVMSPFAGEGANLAMYDGAQLALAIAGHPGDTEAALAAYEAGLFPRAADAARDSAASLDVIFRADSPQGLVDMFAGFDAEKASARPTAR
jgi:2-polyprenyl-6-methoxyphenol hydroxylase-like FAD-dependent oxidoreductase